MRKLSDVVEACNMIKGQRKYNRENYLSKAVCVKFGVGEKLVVWSDVVVQFNKRTGVVSLSSNRLRVGRFSVYPGKNRKLCCTNQHALDELEKRRNRYRIISRNRYALSC